MFDQEFYVQNRRQLQKLAGHKMIVVAGNSLMQRTADSHYPFRQNSDFLYLTGVEEPNMAIVINGVTGEEFIMLDSKSDIHKIFDGDNNVAEISAKSGIVQFMDFKGGYEYIKKHSRGQRVYMNASQKWNKIDFTLNGLRQEISLKLKRRALVVQDIRPLIAQLRMVKQGAEIAAIQQAVNITKQALINIEPLIATAKNENELAIELNVQFAAQDVLHAFNPLIQAGINSTILHYDKHNAAIGNDTVVLFDIGAEFNNYAADISRTFIKGYSKKAEAIVAAVREVQLDMIAQIKPGVSWNNLHRLSEQLVYSKLQELGITNNAKEIRTYFPHAFGHFVGLDTHDAGDYAKPLAKGMTLTVEPGIYLPEESIGVRIEDIVLVTDTGAKVL